MSAIAFDTLKFAKRLKEPGSPSSRPRPWPPPRRNSSNRTWPRNETFADIKRDIADLKRDMKELEVTLRNEIKQLDVKIEQIRSDLTRDLKDLEYRMTIKLGTMMVVAVAAMATLVKLL